MYDIKRLLTEAIENVAFPTEAATALLDAEKKLNCEKRDVIRCMQGMVSDIFTECRPIGDILEELAGIGKAAKVHPYTVHLLEQLYCACKLRQNYKSAGIPEKMFWDFMKDMRGYALSCHELYGVWGTAHGSWAQGYMINKRFAIGSFIFDCGSTYSYESFTKNGITVHTGDKVYKIHIPAGASLKKEDRLRSYKEAYEFFGQKTKGKYMCFVCDSWLLYPENEKLLPKESRIRDFMHDFTIISKKDYEPFKDAWRVFGAAHRLPPDQWPTETGLQKALVKWLSQGGKTGDGVGVFLFDGEKIL